MSKVILAVMVAVVLSLPTGAHAKRLVLMTGDCPAVCEFPLCLVGKGVRRTDIVLCSDPAQADVTVRIPSNIVPQGRSLVPRRLGPAFDLLGAHVLLRCLAPPDCDI